MDPLKEIHTLLTLTMPPINDLTGQRSLKKNSINQTPPNCGNSEKTNHKKTQSKPALLGSSNVLAVFMWVKKERIEKCSFSVSAPV